MALIRCSECGKEVSDKAAACPGCGAPIAESAPKGSLNPSAPVQVTRTGAKWEGTGFILIVVGMIVGMAAVSSYFSTLAGIAAVIGIVVFIIGRFL